jgi:hypothetical protein
MSKRSAQPDPSPLVDRISRYALHLTVILVLVGTLRIAATYSVFGHTVDEGFHMACGLEWITRGTYKIEAQQPPLARLLAAAGPWWIGARLLDGDRSMFDQALAVLYANRHHDRPDYDRRVLCARLGVLPMYWLGAWLIYAWCARWHDRITAMIAVLLFTGLPAILAHSGLANTDMTFTVTFCWCVYMLLRMAETPTLVRGAWFGLALAASLLAKFSTLAFLPAGLIVTLILLYRRDWPGLTSLRRLAPALLTALPVCLIVVWGGYRFHFAHTPALGLTVPAPEFFNGIEEVRRHQAEGHDAYLLGQFNDTSGFWYYYPVALAFKTPMAFLILAAIGTWHAWNQKQWRYWIPLAFVLGILAFTTTSNINIGVRHVLPVFFFLSINAAVAVRCLWLEFSLPWMPRLAAVLVAWCIATSAFSHPDYLAYFNFLAGDTPEDILVDSDLDWGQDMKRLGARLQQLGVQEVAFNPALYGFWMEYHGFPRLLQLDPRAPHPGWNAVSLTLLKYTRMATRKKDPNMRIWTDYTKPTERVGRGILLYYNPAR